MNIQPFIVSSCGRDGSTCLCDSLNSHPNIYCRQEILFVNYNQPSKTRPLDEYLYSEIFARANPKPDITAAGFKLLTTEILNQTSARPYLVGLNCKVIFLERRNRLRQFLSLRLANETKRWHAMVGEQPRTTERTTVDLKAMLAFFNKTSGWYTQARQEFNTCTSINIFYEDLDANFATQTNHLCDFLGVTQTPLTPKTTKLETRAIKEIVVNYDEVCQALKGTMYEWML